jgi:hypothetical protein
MANAAAPYANPTKGTAETNVAVAEEKEIDEGPPDQSQ